MVTHTTDMYKSDFTVGNIYTKPEDGEIKLSTHH